MEYKPVKLGIIGLSPGNGHPYSWAAICNGYNPDILRSSAFPNISEYLGRQSFPNDCLQGVQVSHVWTQDQTLSSHIAASCNIPYICARLEEMPTKVDAILLARDDYEQHAKLAAPFLQAGLPVFIDKPLATSLERAHALLALQQYEGQIFTCSALRFAAELYPTDYELRKIGQLKSISGTTVKGWDKYAIHLIEPTIAFMGPAKTLNTIATHNQGRISLSIDWDNGINTNFTALGPHVKTGGIRIEYEGTAGRIEKQFSDPFNAFKSALALFLETVHTRRRAIKLEETLKTIDLIEAGLRYGAQ